MRAPASPTRSARLTAAAAVLLAAGVLAVAPAASASAHDYLVSSTPAAGSTQTKPLSKVVLTFDDRVLDLSGDGSSNVVEVTRGSGHFESGCATVADTDVSVPVTLGGSGEYTVTWQIVSADGHTVSSSIAFDYVKPEEATAAAARTSRPACGDQASAGSGSSGGASSGQTPAAGSGSSTDDSSAVPATGSTAGAPTSSSDGSSSALPLALGIGGGIVVVALIAVAVVLTRNRTTPAAEGASPRSGQRSQPKRTERGSSRKPPPPGD